MAVSFNTSLNGKAFLKKIGVDPQLIAQVEVSGFSFKLMATKLVIFKGETSYPVSVNLGLLASISQGTAAPHVVAQVKDAATQAMYDCLIGANPQQQVQSEPAPAPAPNLNMKLTPEQAKGASFGAKWPMFDLDKITTAVPVTLKAASRMYQPVRGTSTSSRYFMIAANDDIRVACRYMGNGLSIRIEGPGWKKHHKAFSTFGFSTVDDTKAYASIHLQVGSDLMLANKTLGAVLLGLGIQLETPIPNLQLIAGKGS